jgi:hypothetical protein
MLSMSTRHRLLLRSVASRLICCALLHVPTRGKVLMPCMPHHSETKKHVQSETKQLLHSTLACSSTASGSYYYYNNSSKTRNDVGMCMGVLNYDYLRCLPSHGLAHHLTEIFFQILITLFIPKIIQYYHGISQTILDS